MILVRKVWVGVWCIVLLLGTSPIAHAALKPTVSTAQIRDFTRLTFQWPEQVRFKIAQQANGVTLSFSSPTQMDLGAIRAGLGSHVKSATLSPDGMSVSLTFDQPYRVRHFISGNANGIDIMGATSTTAPAKPPLAPPLKLSTAKNAGLKPIAAPVKPTPPTPPAIKKAPPSILPEKKIAPKTPDAVKAAPSAAAEKAKPAIVPAPAATAPAAVPEASKAAAEVKKPAETPAAQTIPDATQAAISDAAPKPKEVLPEVVKPVQAPAQVPPVAAPTATIPPTTTEAEKTASEPAKPVEIPAAQTPPAAAISPTTAKVEKAVPESAKPVETPAAQTTSVEVPAATIPPTAAEAERAAPEPATPVEAPATQTPAVATPTVTIPPTAAEAEKVASEPEKPKDVAVEQAVTEISPANAEAVNPAATVPAETPPLPTPDLTKVAPPAAPNPYAPTLPKPLPPMNAAQAANADAPMPAATAPAAATSNQPFLITTQTLPTGTEIRFPWMTRTAAAVFMRGTTLWIVFDAKQPVKLDLLKSILPASVTDVSLMEHPTHTILLLQTDGTIHAKVSRSQASVEWIVTLSQYHQIPKILTALTPNPTARIPSILVSTLEYSTPFTVTDPVVGDELVIAPFFNVGEGVYPQRDYTEMTVLESAQGLIIVRKADLATIRPLRNGLKLAAQNGLSISPDLPQIALDELESITAQQTIWFPYDSWRAEPGTFTKTRQDLEQKLVGAGDIRANSIRQKLAQLYLSEGLAYEALGWLDVIKASDPNFYTERQLAAEHGAANFLIDRFDAATADFTQPELNDRPEQKLWLSALKILQESRPRFDYVDYFKGFIGKYPPALREKLAILAADNYINRKSYQKALATFDTLSEAGIAPRLMPYVDFLLGKISADSKKYKTAEALWTPLSQQLGDRFIRARAEFALVSMQYGRGKISLKEAIDRLEKLRVVWRGDSLELSLLHYLGQLYVDDKNYLEGLRAWKELKTQFPSSPILPDVAVEMAKTFQHLFTDGAADELQPLQALSIFYEFRDQVPIGDAGDIMIQGLANRLAKVDLLDRAAALLEHQIQFRQEKLARSKLGAQLALIYVLNHEPDKAIHILEVTGYGDNPPELQRKRVHLAAMALAESGKAPEAIEMLAPDLSRDATLLKLNIQWKEREWRDVINNAEQLLSEREDMTKPLDDTETQYLMQLAIAYMFERDTSQLQYLRTYFTPLLKDGPNKDIFNYVTDASGPIDPKKMEQVNDQIGRIESFMQIYRKRVNEGGLSAAVE